MERGKTELIMLGTGNALVTEYYNTCFVLRNTTTTILVDAGGGNGILRQLKNANVSIGDIHDIYITHAHTDHILGVIWVVRIFVQRKMAGVYTGEMNVWSHRKAINIVKFMCANMLTHKQQEEIENTVHFRELTDGDKFAVGDIKMQCFDILSTKEKQYGFTALLPDGQRLTCLGDEPYNADNARYAEKADWLMCEAFCLYRDKDVFHPYEKNHSTALDAGKMATTLEVRNLILYHTEEKTFGQRKAQYTAEASENYKGNIFVPDDLEHIAL